MNSELAAIDWLGRGWLLILAFTASVLVVAALRKPCRRLFGTERAFQLWLLPPLALLASQLPHAAQASSLPPVVLAIASVPATLPAHVPASGAIDWSMAMLWLWLAGSATVILLSIGAQRRYRRQLCGAMPVKGLALGWPVLRALRADVGPALVGAWHCRIVVPADFECRYDATEQALILAHESCHARRRDGCWCLLAQCGAALFWFHPMAWWVLGALRHDQELACDAAVLREYGKHRRSYANAMLKTQSALFALPVGCLWSPRHPVTERIAMLKHIHLGKSRRHAGRAVIVALALATTGMVYAASRSNPDAAAAVKAGRFTLKVELGVGDQPARLHASICLLPEQYYNVTETDIGQLPPWHGRFAVVPGEQGLLEVQAHLSGGSLAAPVDPKVRTRPGQTATIQVGQQVAGKDGKMLEDHTIRFELTPSLGC